MRDNGTSEIEGEAGVHPLLQVGESREQQERGSDQLERPEESENVVRVAETASRLEQLGRMAELLSGRSDLLEGFEIRFALT